VSEAFRAKQPGPRAILLVSQGNQLLDMLLQSLQLCANEVAHFAAGRTSGVADLEDFREFVESEADGERGANHPHPGDAIVGVAAIPIVGTQGGAQHAFAFVEAKSIGANADEFRKCPRT